MSDTIKSAAQSKLAAIKAFFTGEPVVVTPVVAPVEQAATSGSLSLTLQDGTAIVVNTVDPAATTPSVNDSVLINGVAATAGTWTLADGTMITTDVTSMITAVTPFVAPVTPAPVTIDATATPAPVVKFSAETAPISKEDFAKIAEAFATGTPDEQLANLWIITRALMNYAFGYEMQKQQTADAINVYKNEIASVTTMMGKHNETIPMVLDLVEEIVKLPINDPATLEGNQKDKFTKRNKREQMLEGIAAGIKSLKK